MHPKAVMVPLQNSVPALLCEVVRRRRPLSSPDWKKPLGSLTIRMNETGSVRGGARRILRLEALFALIALFCLYQWLHGNWILFVVLILAPDVAMIGYLRNTRVGAWLYNALHTYVGPVLLGGFALFSHALLPYVVIWAAHIAMDRALGFGLKYGDYFGHTHLGMIGGSR